MNSDKIKKNEEVDAYLRRAIKKGLIFKRIKKNLVHYKKSTFWGILKKDYKNLRKEYTENINYPLYKEIDNMIKKDQSSRGAIFGGSKKSRITDDSNYKKLFSIIKNIKKWPGFSIIGENTPKGKYDVTGNISLMLLHFKKEQIKVLEPYMLDAVLNGEMYPYHYARILDYTSSKITIEKDSLTGKKSIKQCFEYGTYLNESICDCDRAEQKRKKIGFEPIKDYYQKRKSTYYCN
ncbi:hypothetical protein [Tenacibaculum sp. Ill]|uniref:hypothetical protein n=1 Tax=Tenacibaculum sp. Ill TaxID=3445935 RepID=UPI003F7AF2CB